MNMEEAKHRALDCADKHSAEYWEQIAEMMYCKDEALYQLAEIKRLLARQIYARIATSDIRKVGKQ